MVHIYIYIYIYIYHTPHIHTDTYASKMNSSTLSSPHDRNLQLPNHTQAGGTPEEVVASILGHHAEPGNHGLSLLLEWALTFTVSFGFRVEGAGLLRRMVGVAQ